MSLSAKTAVESSKRARVEARPTVQDSYDQTRFCSKEAQRIYNEESFLQKHPLCERGVLWPGNHSPVTTWYLQTRPWGPLLDIPNTQGCLRIVREFYANASVGGGLALRSTIVRQNLVSWDGDTIARYLGIDRVDNCEYEAYKEAPNNEDIARRLCLPGGDWHTRFHDGTATRLLMRGVLNEEAVTWLHIINSRLMPTLHMSTLDHKRTVLMYCILEEMNIDVCNIISDSLHDAVQNRRGMYFPFMITDLCRQERVQWTSLRPFLKAGAIIKSKKEGTKQLPGEPKDFTALVSVIREVQAEQREIRVQQRRAATSRRRMREYSFSQDHIRAERERQIAEANGVVMSNFPAYDPPFEVWSDDEGAVAEAEEGIDPTD